MYSHGPRYMLKRNGYIYKKVGANLSNLLRDMGQRSRTPVRRWLDKFKHFIQAIPMAADIMIPLFASPKATLEDMMWM